MPSDLIHMQTIRYTDYLDLMKKLYFRLPAFLMRTQLRKPLDLKEVVAIEVKKTTLLQALYSTQKPPLNQADITAKTARLKLWVLPSVS